MRRWVSKREWEARGCVSKRFAAVRAGRVSGSQRGAAREQVSSQGHDDVITLKIDLPPGQRTTRSEVTELKIDHWVLPTESRSTRIISLTPYYSQRLRFANC